VIVNVASGRRARRARSTCRVLRLEGGLVGLTRAVAVDPAKEGIRCVAICPVTVETEWINKSLANAEDPEAARAAMTARQLDGQLGSPQEVAGVIAFVAGEEGRFINGTALIVDGGLTAI
jgi:NAD(P)-dependent dehydrogenase (short-subunit alcohol dehydrogenase family)